MSELLSGKTAVVTGGMSGNGRATAKTFAEHGTDVVVADVREEPRGATVPTHESIEEETGAGATYVECDVTDKDDLVTATNAADEFGGVDVMVNNAGIFRSEEFLSVSEAEFDQLIDINVKGAFFGTQVAAERMQDNGGGSIIQMSSQAGHTGLRDRTVYCSTKFAIEGMTRAMAVDLKGSGIRVNTVAPTFVHTEMTAAQLERSDFRDYVDAHILTGKLAEMNEVAAAVIYLASDAAASTTGTSIGVDGGWLAH